MAYPERSPPTQENLPRDRKVRLFHGHEVEMIGTDTDI